MGFVYSLLPLPIVKRIKRTRQGKEDGQTSNKDTGYRYELDKVEHKQGDTF